MKAPPGANADEAREVAATRAALKPVLAVGISPWRIASAAGAHPADMQGFLEGRVSLTWELRRRLREQIPGLIAEADPDRVK